MDRVRLEYLEKRYWEGKTSLDEEAELKKAVHAGAEGVSEPLIALLGEIEENKSLSLNADFDEAFWQKAENENSSGEAQIFTLSLFMRYAAVGIILFGLSFAIWNIIVNSDLMAPAPIVQTEIGVDDTYEDPQVAFEETKRALMFASEKLNKGKEPIQEIKRFYNAKVSIAGMHSDTSNTVNNKKK